MAKRFLDHLAKIPESELSKDSCCMICHRNYGTDSADVAVRLPCDHHVGLECITIWLCPDRDSKNSCPMCRSVFFDVVEAEEELIAVEVLEEFDLAEPSEEEEYSRHVISRVGQPPGERLAGGETSQSELEWYSYFVDAAAEQYQESLTRARAFFVKSFSGRDELEREEQFRAYFLAHPGMEERAIADQATAFRTLAVRETLLYLEFGRDGVFPPLESPIRGPLSAEQSQTLFQELQRRGAFDIDLHPFRHYDGLTDEQMWFLHQEEGECYSTSDEGFWSLALG